MKALPWKTCSTLFHQQLYKLAIWGCVLHFVLGAHMTKRETSCPVLWDPEWQHRDQQCTDGKKYHCFEDENGHVASDGCYHTKMCLIGAHPEVEGTSIICSYCQTGFQPQNNLSSHQYRFSYCQLHSRLCKQEYGESECQAATRERDRACTCNATLGFRPRVDPDNCHCFGPNDPCAGCIFVECLHGYIKNDQGFCVPDHNPTSGIPSTIGPTSRPTSFSSMGTTPPVSSDDSGNQLSTGGIAAIVILLILLIVAFVIYCFRRTLLKCVRMCQQQICSAGTNDENSGNRPNDTESPKTDLAEEKESTKEQNGHYDVADNPPGKGLTTVWIDEDKSRGKIVVNNGNVTQNYHIKNVRHFELKFGNDGCVENASEGVDCTSSPPTDPPVSTSPDLGDTSRPCTMPQATGQPEVAGSASIAIPVPESSTPVSPYETERLLPTPPTYPLPSEDPAPASPSGFLNEPSAPPLSLPIPSAPPPSLPVSDQMEDEQGIDAESGDTDETSIKTRLLSGDEESCREVAISSQNDETDVKTPLLPSDDEQTLRKVSSQDDETDVKTPLLAGSSQGGVCQGANVSSDVNEHESNRVNSVKTLNTVPTNVCVPAEEEIDLSIIRG